MAHRIKKENFKGELRLLLASGDDHEGKLKRLWLIFKQGATWYRIEKYDGDALDIYVIEDATKFKEAIKEYNKL